MKLSPKLSAGSAVRTVQPHRGVSSSARGQQTRELSGCHRNRSQESSCCRKSRCPNHPDRRGHIVWVGLSLSEHRCSAPGTELGSEVILVNIPCYPNTLTFPALAARDALLGRCIYNIAFIHRHRHTHILVHIYKPSFFLTTPNHLSVSRIKTII